MLKRLFRSGLASARSAPKAAEPDLTPLLRGALDAQQAGDVETAEKRLREAIALAPAAAAPHALLAELLRGAGRIDEARATYERATALGPQAPEFLFNYAALLTREEDRSRASELYRDIVDERPEWHLPYLKWGWLALESGTEGKEAVRLFGRALAVKNDSVEAHLGLALALLREHALERAAEHARIVLAADPANLPARGVLAAVYRRLGDAESLRRVLSERLGGPDADGARIALAIAIPAIVDSRDEITAIRQTLHKDLDRLLATPLSVSDPMKEVGATTFYLAYQGEDDRDLHERLAKVHLHACPALAYTAPHCEKPTRHERLRIGIVSSALHEHSIARVMHGLISRLDRTRFSVHLYACQTTYDERSRALERDADEWLLVPRELAAARECIAGGELDVVLYPDIGMDAFTYFLAFSRLAPVQCVTWGHPVTTGIPAIDYFVSTDYFETAEADRQYSERLVRFEDVAFPGYYPRPNLPQAPALAVGFDRARRVYFCPQRLFKHHPDFDPLLAAILRRDPAGEVVCTYLPDEDEWRLKKLKARMARACGDVFDRIVFLPALPTFAGYVERLRRCHVVLDTIHYCGGNTSLEAISAGALVVTLPSAFSRGRHTYGFFRKMRFMETVAASAEDYVERAVRIATDDELRAELRRRQAEASAALYEDAGAVRQFHDFFERAVNEAHTR